MKLSMKITSGYVFDPTALHVKEIDRLQGFFNSVVCYGNTKGYCVNEVVAVARAVTGRLIPGAIEGRRPGDLALHERLDTIVETAWNWFRKIYR
jgi:UDP-glucose 4-epimerase